MGDNYEREREDRKIEAENEAATAKAKRRTDFYLEGLRTRTWDPYIRDVQLGDDISPTPRPASVGTGELTGNSETTVDPLEGWADDIARLAYLGPGIAYDTIDRLLPLDRTPFGMASDATGKFVTLRRNAVRACLGIEPGLSPPLQCGPRQTVHLALTVARIDGPHDARVESAEFLARIANSRLSSLDLFIAYARQQRGGSAM